MSSSAGLAPRRSRMLALAGQQQRRQTNQRRLQPINLVACHRGIQPITGAFRLWM